METILGFVSVVNIAEAALFQPLFLSLDNALLNAFMYLSTGNASPITPVEKGMTFFCSIFKSDAISLQYFFTSLIPFCPLAALAFPAFIRRTFGPFLSADRF